MLSAPVTADIPFFFIIGRPRSGTTLLRTLLDAHPNIGIPTECNFIMALAARYAHKKRFSQQTLLNFCNDLSYARYFDKLPLRRKELRDAILSQPADTQYATLCRLVTASYISVYEKGEIMALGDKNPAYSSENFRRVYGLIPGARYIHIVRDYRDMIVSLKKGGFRMPSVEFMARSWVQSLKTIHTVSESDKASFYRVRYEDLVMNPEQEMKNICTYLGVPYYSEILDFHTRKEAFEIKQKQMNIAAYHRSLFQPINASRCGLWKSELSRSEIIAAESIAGIAGAELGYEPSGITPAGKNKPGGALQYRALTFLRNVVQKLPLNLRASAVKRLKNNRMAVRFHEKSQKKLNSD